MSGSSDYTRTPNYSYNEGMSKRRWQDRVIPEPNSGCWLWEGAASGRGYGYASRNGKLALVHRLAWEEAHGPIPDGMDVCHQCDMPPCCNPDHLFLGTARDNSRDMMEKGRQRFGCGIHNLRKTHCAQGHPLQGENLRIDSNGSRQCRQCDLRRWRAAERRKAEKRVRT